MTRSRWIVLALAAAAVAAFFALGLDEYLSLAYFRSRQQQIASFTSADPLVAGAIFFAIYVAVTAASLPGAAVMTLAAGAIFGLFWGTVLVSFASAIGATLAFVIARFLLRDAVQRRFGERLRAIDAGVEKDGAFYLFGLRLVPVFPFFLINLAMALTPLRTATFYWVSQAGMLAGTLVYVNAGTELARIDSPSGILSPGLIGSFLLLAIFPFVARRVLEAVKARKVYSKWQRPRSFERNLVVIGGGSAGLSSAYIAAAVKARVTLVERHRMGGDCLNTGCVPSKALLRSAKLLAQMRRAPEFGLGRNEPQFDFAQVMERVQRVIRSVAPHDSVERYTALGVECLEGDAKIVSPWEVEVKAAAGTRRITTAAIVIAAGARPFVPPIPGIDEVGYLTSDDVWELRDSPRRLLVLGGGPIGCELTQAFARLGSQVTQVEMLPRILIREDPEVSQALMQRFAAEGVDVRTGHKAERFVVENGEKLLVAQGPQGEVRIGFDALLVAVGRVANTQGYGLEELGIAVTRTRTIETDESLRTIYPNILACGDVAGPFQFTHTAAHQAWYATVNALFGRLRTFKADYSVVPWVTFTDPEVARVGLNETEAKQKNIAYETTRYPLEELDRAIADEAAHGMVKVLTVPGSDRILGVTIVGEHAGELIAEYVLAMKHGIGMNRILATIHTYPTFAEANKHAAGRWKHAHAPAALLAWVARYHAWVRA